MSKTVFVSHIMVFLGFLSLIGVDLPLDTIESLLLGISDDSMEVFIIIHGAVMLWLRRVTSSPLAKGVNGLIGMKQKPEATA